VKLPKCVESPQNTSLSPSLRPSFPPCLHQSRSRSSFRSRSRSWVPLPPSLPPPSFSFTHTSLFLSHWNGLPKTVAEQSSSADARIVQLVEPCDTLLVVLVDYVVLSLDVRGKPACTYFNCRCRSRWHFERTFFGIITEATNVQKTKDERRKNQCE